jgi:hypothetical protein
MSFSKLTRALLLPALTIVACASSGGGGADAPGDDGAVDCSTLPACDDKLQCSGGDQCFKLKRCDGFVCAGAKVACKSECGVGADCLLLESQPMMLSCR